MKDAIERALLALTEHEHVCTERWQTARYQLSEAKDTEVFARCAMDAAADLREKLADFLSSLPVEGAK